MENTTKIRKMDLLMEVADLDYLVESQNVEDRIDAARSVYVKPEQLIKLLDDVVFIVASLATSSKNATEEVLLEAAKKSSALVRREAMKSKNATERVLLIGANDPDPDVRISVLQNLNCSVNVLRVFQKCETDPKVFKCMSVEQPVIERREINKEYYK